VYFDDFVNYDSHTFNALEGAAMMTDKEFATIRTQARIRDTEMRAARRWADDDNKYTDRKTCVKYAREAIKRARKANRKLVAAKAAGSARPVTVVLAAVLPLMEGFAKAAADRTLEHIAKVRAKVQAEGLDVAYPEPARLSGNDLWNRDKQFAYELARDRRSFAQRITGEHAEQVAAETVEEAVYVARSSFLSYAWKLDTKVGDVTAAKLTTVYGVWGESFLDVTKADGSVIRWKTQTITNHSVYGTPYFQWPTRIVKM
jgi:hypothetical protein